VDSTSLAPDNNTDTAELASPLAWLLEEERHADRQARSALFLSFTLDHAFFESIVLGVVQATGARVAVAGDAWVNRTDPLGVRRAGRGYLAGYATCRRNFHPKLIVLTGSARSMVAIGSGNTTLSGWHGNAELWTVLHGTPDTAPAAFGQVADWLRRMPQHVRFSQGLAEYLDTVAGELDAFPIKEPATGPQVLDNLTVPIIDQLPTGPVDELAVSAPFHDPSAAALHALVNRLTPRRLVIAYQPTFTQLDGAAVATLVEQTNATVHVDPEPRYRHGKLIEWAINGRRFALTGSANLSTAALLSTTADGGNCELATLSDIATSRMPTPEPSDHDQLRRQRISTIHHRPPGPVLLGATRTPTGLLVETATPLSVPATVELAPRAPHHLTWRQIGPFPPGELHTTLPVDTEGGMRVRLSTSSPDGQRHSPPIPVTDPTLVLRRPSFADSARPSTTPTDLFTGKPGLQDKFTADLAALRTAYTAGAIPTSGPSGTGPSSTQAAGSSGQGWEAYLDRCTHQLGQPLIRFALGLPSLTDHTQDDDPDPDVPTDDTELDEDAELSLEGDQAEDLTDDPTPTDPAADSNVINAAVGARYRRWARSLAATVPHVDIVERLLLIRLLLWTIGGGAWSPDDRDWMPLLATTLTQLAKEDPLPPEFETSTASLAAVALAILRIHTPRAAHTAETSAYRTGITATSHLLPAAEPTHVAEYASGFAYLLGYSLHPDAVLDLAAEIVQDDPLQDAIRGLTEQHLHAHRDGPHLLHVTGNIRRPELSALRAIGAAEHADRVAALATTNTGSWTLLIWRKPDLFRIDGTPHTTLWRHYHLPIRITPNSLALAKSYENATEIRRTNWTTPIPDALHLLHELGIDPTRPPTCTP
jgi:hypothetical protein